MKPIKSPIQCIPGFFFLRVKWLGCEVNHIKYRKVKKMSKASIFLQRHISTFKKNGKVHLTIGHEGPQGK
jgi:hypothetical protein